MDQPLKPVFPNRPFLFDSDFPKPVDSPADAPYPPYDQELAEFNYQRSRRVDAARLRQSGELARDWDRREGPRSPGEYEQRMLEDAAHRAQRNGLPDSPESMPPQFRDGGGLPFKF